MLLIIIMYALLAGTFSLSKVLLAYTQPIFLVGIRMSIAGGLLLLYKFFRNKTSFLRRNDWLLYVQITIFTIYIPYLLRYWSLCYLSASKACLMYNCAPFMSYLFAYLLSAEIITLRKTVGLIIGFIGLLPITLQRNSIATGHCPYPLLPELAIFLAVSSSSYGWILVHRLLKKNFCPIATNGIAMFGGGLLALLTSLMFEPTHLYITDPIPFIALLAVIIVVSNLICHNLYGILLRTHTPTLLSFAGFLSPIFAAFYGWLFLHEMITWQFYFSAIAVFIGLTLFYGGELRVQQPATAT